MCIRLSPRCGSSRISSNIRRTRCRNSTRSRSRATTCRRRARTWCRSLPITLADGREYVRAAIARGMDVDKFAGRLSFLFRHRHELFHGGGKAACGAACCGHRIMEDFSSRRIPNRSKMLRTHCQTSGVSLQEQDPYNNVIRTAYEAMSAVLGGTQSLHTNALDEAIALPTDFSAHELRAIRS